MGKVCPHVDLTENCIFSGCQLAGGDGETWQRGRGEERGLTISKIGLMHFYEHNKQT